MNVIGYLRASTPGQVHSLETQRHQLLSSGHTIVEFYSDVGSGSRVGPGLQAALKRASDEGLPVMVVRPDRFARSVAVFRRLENHKVPILSLEGPVTADSVHLAETSLAALRSAQLAGVRAAKNRGVYRGRPVSIDPQPILSALAQGARPADVARSFGVARSTVYRLKEQIISEPDIQRAEHEGELIRKRTRDGLAAAKRRGVRLGNPNGASALRRAGKGNRAALVARAGAANDRALALASSVAEARAGGATSLREIADALTGLGIAAPRGGPWHPSGVNRLLMRIAVNEQGIGE